MIDERKLIAYLKGLKGTTKYAGLKEEALLDKLIDEVAKNKAFKTTITDVLEEVKYYTCDNCKRAEECDESGFTLECHLDVL